MSHPLVSHVTMYGIPYGTVTQIGKDREDVPCWSCGASMPGWTGAYECLACEVRCDRGGLKPGRTMYTEAGHTWGFSHNVGRYWTEEVQYVDFSDPLAPHSPA